MSTEWVPVMRDGRGISVPQTKIVEFWRDGWENPITGRLIDFDPHMNIIGLFWREVRAGT